MTDITLHAIHDMYQEALHYSHNILDVLNNLYKLMLVFDVCEEDSEEFDSFVRKIDTSRRIRSKDFQMTNLVSDLTFAIIYIIIWLNETQKLGLDTSISARRKSLESELRKLLEKNHDYDLYGLRAVVLNDFEADQEAHTKKLFALHKFIVGILTNSNRKASNDFIQWIMQSEDVEAFTRQRVLYTIDLPWIAPIVKDYISNPKQNGYQSIHTVLQLEMYSSILPGAQVEFQLRSNWMHREAVKGTASHKAYKSLNPNGWVFAIDNFDAHHNLFGFADPDSPENDIDGIFSPKRLLTRRISSSMISDLRY